MSRLKFHLHDQKGSQFILTLVNWLRFQRKRFPIQNTLWGLILSSHQILVKRTILPSQCYLQLFPKTLVPPIQTHPQEVCHRSHPLAVSPQTDFHWLNPKHHLRKKGLYQVQLMMSNPLWYFLNPNHFFTFLAHENTFKKMILEFSLNVLYRVIGW